MGNENPVVMVKRNKISHCTHRNKIKIFSQIGRINFHPLKPSEIAKP